MEVKSLINEVTHRVYFVETDVGGVVYFGNMSKYVEKGFTEWFREHVRSLKTLNLENDIFFVVSSTNQKFLKSIKYDNAITIRTTLRKLKYFSISFETQVFVEGDECFSGETTLIPVNIHTKKPVALPQELLLLNKDKKVKV